MNTIFVLAAEAAERGQWWPESWFGRFWVMFGLVAQAVFAGRFIVQWIASEVRGRSYVPVAFWYLSIVGGLMLLTYFACWKHDTVGTIGQTTGLVVYVRNLMLLEKEKGQAMQGTQQPAAGSEPPPR